MYQKISIFAFIITFIGIAFSYVIRPSKKCGKNPVKAIVNVCTLPFSWKKLSLAMVFRKLIYLLALFSFVVLAITGFYPTLVLGEHISGYLIMIHATFAPILAICLTVLAVMWAHKGIFNNADWPWFNKMVERVTLAKCNTGTSDKKSCLGQKITFWMILFLSLPLILSIVSSMLPYFGTHWQETFLFIHRYTALVFAIVVIIHTHLVIRAQAE